MSRRQLINREPEILPLFNWPALCEIDQFEMQRLDLQRRIGLLPPKSERAVELRARLKEVTTRQLMLQNRLRRLS
jgi:hypothetical protein